MKREGKRTTIVVHESTKRLLDELKVHRREPYEEVILRLIEFYKKHSRP